MRRQILIPLVLVLLAGCIAIVYFKNAPNVGDSALAPIEELQMEENTIANGSPTFTWKFIPLDDAEIPHTEIRLSARYPDGTDREERIDTIEGACNAYEPRDADAFPESDMIICYYAGLGRYYKIVATGDEYLVQRREFEEASPDYAPPQQAYKTVARF